MIWFVVAALVFGFVGGLLIGMKTEERVWLDVFGEYLEKQPTASELQRVLAVVSRMERAAKPAAPYVEESPAMMDADELRERTPKRLRESADRTFWS